MVSHLRDFREAQTIWFLVCGTSARLKPFGFLFSELPRSPNYLVFHLRNSREAKTIWFLICGTSAEPKPFSFSFAELPRGPTECISILPHFIISHIAGLIGVVGFLVDKVGLGKSAILGHRVRTDYKLGDVIIGCELNDFDAGGDVFCLHCFVELFDDFLAVDDVDAAAGIRYAAALEVIDDVFFCGHNQSLRIKGNRRSYRECNYLK